MSQSEQHRQTIREALSALQQRRNDDAFVIFSETRTGKFVQFAGGAGQPLLLDLPAQTLDEKEMSRAIAYFHSLGEHFQEYDVYDAQGGEVAGRQFSFQLSLDDHIDLAAQITLDIFLRIYRFAPDFALEVEIN